MKVLLTGATGFLGGHLLPALLDAGHEVIVLKRRTSQCRRIEAYLGQCAVCDVESQSFAALFEAYHPETVIHCATVYGRNGKDFDAVVQGNLIFPLQLLDAALDAGCNRFINTDSFFTKQMPSRLEEGRPVILPDYTLSKFQFRQWGRMRTMDRSATFVNLQLEHIYGDGDRSDKFIPWLKHQFSIDAPYVDLTEGTQMRDFVQVERVVDVYLQVLEDIPSLTGYHSYCVGTGQAKPLSQFVEELKDSMGAHTQLRFGARETSPAEILYSVADADSPYLVDRCKRLDQEGRRNV